MSKELALGEELSEDMPIVSPNGRREELLQKLDTFKIRNLNAKEKGILDSWADRFASSFVYFAWEKLGVSKSQLRTLSREDLVELVDLLYETVKTRALVRKYFWQPFYACTLFGNIFIWDHFNEGQRPWHSWQYVCTMEMLKKTYGKDWFPFDDVIAMCNRN